MLNQTIFQGKQGEYYIHNGVRYDSHFPLEWALNHNPSEETANCGPERCIMCDERGYFRKVFVGYCRTCADAYKNERGCAEHRWFSDCAALFQEYDELNIEEFMPYMAGVKMEAIGDDEDEPCSTVNDDVCPTQEEMDAYFRELERREQEYQEDDAFGSEPDEQRNYYDYDDDCYMNEPLNCCPDDIRAMCDRAHQEAFNNFRAECAENHI
jgi:hypothetical protein